MHSLLSGSQCAAFTHALVLLQSLSTLHAPGPGCGLPPSPPAPSTVAPSPPIAPSSPPPPPPSNVPIFDSSRPSEHPTATSAPPAPAMHASAAPHTYFRDPSRSIRTPPAASRRRASVRARATTSLSSLRQSALSALLPPLPLPRLRSW